jgi:histone H3/H4
VLDTVQNKSIAAYQRYNGDAILTSNLKALNKEILKTTGLVSSSDIEEMKEIIEDLANWKLNEQ